MFAEIYALKVGLEILWNTGCRSVITEVDCGELFTILRDNSRVTFHVFRGLLLDIQNLLERPWNCRLVQVSREANQVADWLAKHGAQNASTANVTLADPPLEVQALLLRDYCDVV